MSGEFQATTAVVPSVNTGAGAPLARSATTSKVLHWSLYSWFAIAMAGQWLFALYITARYATPVVSGDYARINQGPFIGGYKAGEFGYNLMYLGHILPVIVLAIGGVLQFVPALRRRFPKAHRYNGRLFFALGLSGAATGLWLTWGAGNRLSDLGAVGITLNGLLIPIAIVMAWRYAILRQFTAHQRWAVHSFLLVNAVWSFRLYLYGWFLVNQGPVGNSRTLDGPMDLFFSFACYLVPMAVAELVFWSKRTGKGQKAVATLLVIGCLVTLIGIVAIGLMNWGPALRRW